jgi:hypothetical protein
MTGDEVPDAAAEFVDVAEAVMLLLFMYEGLGLLFGCVSHCLTADSRCSFRFISAYVGRSFFDLTKRREKRLRRELWEGVERGGERDKNG